MELYFDPALENQVLKAWNALARRHLGSRLIDAAARPHLPLLHLPAAALPPPGTGAAGDPLLRLGTSLRALASRLDPLPLALSSLAALPASAAASPNDNVLFLAPTPSAALLGLHAQLCELLRKDAGVEVPDAFRPDHWVPQCAVAVDVPRGRMGSMQTERRTASNSDVLWQMNTKYECDGAKTIFFSVHGQKSPLNGVLHLIFPFTYNNEQFFFFDMTMNYDVPNKPCWISS